LSICLAASISYSSPILTLFATVFFFLPNSSIELVGSAPAESKKRTGTFGRDSSKIS